MPHDQYNSNVEFPPEFNTNMDYHVVDEPNYEDDEYALDVH